MNLGITDVVVTPPSPTNEVFGAYSSKSPAPGDPKKCFAVPAGVLKGLVVEVSLNSLPTPLLCALIPVGGPPVTVPVTVPPGGTGVFAIGPLAIPLPAGPYQWHIVTPPGPPGPVANLCAGARVDPL